MEFEVHHTSPAADPMPASSGLPQKRKEPPAAVVLPRSALKHDVNHTQISPHEASADVVKCEDCGEQVPCRDEGSGSFTTKKWDEHKQKWQVPDRPNSEQTIRPNCRVSPNAKQHSPTAPSHTPEPQSDHTGQPPNKRRRPKRNEEERIAYLRTDPYVAQFEAYRVLCASCDKWIRLRPNSTYCSIPWDAHRKSCLAKRNAKSGNPSDERSSVFAKDPYVRKFDTERVQCKNCEKWVSLGHSDNMTALQTWNQHRSSCVPNAPSLIAPSVASSASASIPTIDSVPPPSKHLLAMVSSAKLPLPANLTALPPSLSPSSFKDLTPTNFPPAQESRRRNAEQRAAALRSDPLIGEVEPNRVFCSLCQKWVQLRQDSSYCAHPWLQHRSKCLNRQMVGAQRRAQREGEGATSSSQKQAGDLSKSEDAMDTDEPESEDGAEAGVDAEEQARRRAARREEKRQARDAVRAGRKKEGGVSGAVAPSLAYPDDADAEGEPDDLDEDLGNPIRLADLDAPAGRLDFAFASVRHLFKTTYSRADDLTIATLVAYLNAAMPPDKHEDFDTKEVTKAAMALHERGDFVLEGDVIRIPE
ncbi:hypothetical protein K474DRAFT_1709125 [Panus rudis PR-1116 ss-1]|nr:hypothetical protein K474DRAFT_1709125 [Panus rudis PR-1116 ss-1]